MDACTLDTCEVAPGFDSFETYPDALRAYVVCNDTRGLPSRWLTEQGVDARDSDGACPR